MDTFSGPEPGPQVGTVNLSALLGKQLVAMWVTPTGYGDQIIQLMRVAVAHDKPGSETINVFSAIQDKSAAKQGIGAFTLHVLYEG